MAYLFLFTNILFIYLIACSPVLIVIALAASRWRMPEFFHRVAFHSALFSIVLGFSDFVLLKALPHLNLSYGPLAIPLAVWWGMRYLLFIVWTGFSRWLLQRQKQLSQLRIMFLAFNLLLTGLLLYGFYYEPFNLGVTYLEEDINLAGDSPIRIVHVTDIHLERTTIREERLVSLVNEQRPDLILLTGDYLNLSNLDDPVSMEQLRELLAQFEAPLGVYAVNGTVDGPDLMQRIFGGLDITVLDDETRQLSLAAGDLHLVGISNHNYEQDAADLASLTDEIPPAAAAILLYHTPDLIETAAQAGIDLYLAGHTHGGQVRLPIYGALLTLSRYGKRFEMGAYQFEDTTLYVSRGIGLEGSFAPRLRFLCPPEITVIDLK